MVTVNGQTYCDSAVAAAGAKRVSKGQQQFIQVVQPPTLGATHQLREGGVMADKKQRRREIRGMIGSSIDSSSDSETQPGSLINI